MSTVTAPADFTWSTAQQVAVAPVSGGNIVLSRASGLAVGPVGSVVKLMVSDSICTHPALGKLKNPMVTNVYATYALTTAESALTSVPIDLQLIQIPAAVSTVLIQVVDGNSILYSKRQAVSTLAGLAVTFSDIVPDPSVATYMDQCP
jgi:hypothetical protein